MMTALSETHPDVHKKFEEGFHVVRRSNRYWAGMSTDLIIEQVLMRSVKTHEGLTRRQGFTETQRLVWGLLMPACGNINNAMQSFTGVSYKASNQHKDLSKARQTRDVSDTLALVTHLKENDLLTENPSLHNIANGMTAQQGVNVEKSREIWCKNLESMVGKPVEEFIFRKADKQRHLHLGQLSN